MSKLCEKVKDEIRGKFLLNKKLQQKKKKKNWSRAIMVNQKEEERSNQLQETKARETMEIEWKEDRQQRDFERRS